MDSAFCPHYPISKTCLNKTNLCHEKEYIHFTVITYFLPFLPVGHQQQPAPNHDQATHENVRTKYL